MGCNQWVEEHGHLGSISTERQVKDCWRSQEIGLHCARPLPAGKGSRVGYQLHTYPSGSVCEQTARPPYPLLEETVGLHG